MVESATSTLSMWVILVEKTYVSLSCWCSRACSPPITSDLMIELSCFLPAPSISIYHFISCPLTFQILLTVALVQDTLEWKHSVAKIMTQYLGNKSLHFSRSLEPFCNYQPKSKYVDSKNMTEYFICVCVYTGVQVSTTVVCSDTHHPTFQHTRSGPDLFLVLPTGVFSLP